MLRLPSWRTVGLSTRSGTNKYAGSVFEYFRNEATDANDWFSNFNNIARPARLKMTPAEVRRGTRSVMKPKSKQQEHAHAAASR